MNNKIIIAAYGTLRKGYGNSHRVDKPSTNWLGEGLTVEKYQMTATSFPFVNKTPDTRIKVDCWEIDINEDLPAVDALEGHPDWYIREEIKIELDSGDIVNAWLYFMDKSLGCGNTIIDTGDYKDYRQCAV